VVASCIAIMSLSALLFLYDLEFLGFTIYASGVFLFAAIVDTIGEGTTALITKYERRLGELYSSILYAPASNPRRQRRGNQNAFGIFISFRNVTTGISIFIGGLISKMLKIKYIYAIYACFASILMIYVLVIFREEPV